jgi:hypothetical protein
MKGGRGNINLGFRNGRVAAMSGGAGGGQVGQEILDDWHISVSERGQKFDLIKRFGHCKDILVFSKTAKRENAILAVRSLGPPRRAP